MKHTSCEGCEYQKNSKLGIIEKNDNPKNFKKIEIDFIHYQCWSCYAWPKLNQERKNYIPSKVKNFINEIFKELL